jgi:hypothetical protein
MGLGRNPNPKKVGSIQLQVSTYCGSIDYKIMTIAMTSS